MKPKSEHKTVRGRFAPSPSGRMHLGNVMTALVSWLSVRSQGGRWLLRIEDLDPQRSKMEFARLIEDDLHWLGLDWDEGGVSGSLPQAPCMQSLRHDVYQECLKRLDSLGILYPCSCTRADILSTQAPHETDGRVIYKGTCRPSPRPPFAPCASEGDTLRMYVPEETIRFHDLVCGPQAVDLARQCGDFVVRRADGAWAYQLAVVADDALMGVTEVVRGNDLLISAAQQIHLFRLLGFEPPRFAHLPLVCDPEGRRLCKRHASLAMDRLRSSRSPQEVTGMAAFLAGIIPSPQPCSPADLISGFDWQKIRQTSTVTIEYQHNK